MNIYLIVASLVILSLIIIATLIILNRHLVRLSDLKTRRQKFDEIIAYNELYKDIQTFESYVDTYIEQIFLWYQLFHSDLFDKDYITEKDQKEMITEVTKEVLEFMSPTLYSQMLLIYNSEKVNEVINKKVIFMVLRLVAEHNTSVAGE